MCDRQESRLYGQNFQGEIFATSVAISCGWKPSERGGLFRIWFLAGKASLLTSLSMQSRTGEGEAYQTGAPSPPAAVRFVFRKDDSACRQPRRCVPGSHASRYWIPESRTSLTRRYGVWQTVRVTLQLTAKP